MKMSGEGSGFKEKQFNGLCEWLKVMIFKYWSMEHLRLRLHRLFVDDV